jgi:hypothetical protein
MRLPQAHLTTVELGDRLRNTHAVTAELMSEVIGAACRRFPSPGQSGKTARIERFIRAEAWTDAALALIDLELPLWHVRRIAYDEGEWYCALSRECELPEWLDRSIEWRFRRGPACRRSIEPAQRPDRRARREPALCGALLR